MIVLVRTEQEQAAASGGLKRDWRMVLVRLVLLFGPPLISFRVSAIAQTGAVLSEFIVPEEIRVNPITEDKPESRVVPGLEDLGYRYNYDPAASKGGRLQLFEMERKCETASWPPSFFEWKTTTDLEDGTLYSFQGRVYRWDGASSKLVHEAKYPTLPPRLREKRIAVSRRLYLKWPRQTDTRFQLDIKEFDLASDAASDRAKVQLYVHDDRHLELPDQSVTGSSATPWVRVGDHIRSEDWDLTLDRIVRADSADGNPGWVEFSINPGVKRKH
jgi:hypothetical protein